MRPGPITQTAQQLLAAQDRLQRIGGLLWTSMRHRHTPDGFSREQKAENRQQLVRTEVDAWFQRNSLPTEAPNDPQPTPGRA